MSTERMKWQPIETAPNNQSILVARSPGYIELVDAEDNDYDWGPYEDNGLDNPTHWMPLPELPR